MKVYLIRANKYSQSPSKIGRIRLGTLDKELAEEIQKKIGKKYYVQECYIQNMEVHE